MDENISKLPVEIQMIILSKLPYWQIKLYCRANLLANEICKSPHFWFNKSKLEFNVTWEQFIKTRLSPSDRYLEIKFETKLRHNSCYLNFLNTIRCLIKLIEDNDLDLIIYLVQTNMVSVDNVLFNAITHDNVNIIEWAINHGGNYYEILKHIDMISDAN